MYDKKSSSYSLQKLSSNKSESFTSGYSKFVFTNYINYNYVFNFTYKNYYIFLINYFYQNKKFDLFFNIKEILTKTFSFGFYYIQGMVFILFIDACLTDDEPL